MQYVNTHIPWQSFQSCVYYFVVSEYLQGGGAAVAQTEAQLRASKKYHQKFDNLQIRVPQGEKEVIAAHAASQNESLNTFVRRAISETMKRDNCDTKEE